MHHFILTRANAIYKCFISVAPTRQSAALSPELSLVKKYYKKTDYTCDASLAPHCTAPHRTPAHRTPLRIVARLALPPVRRAAQNMAMLARATSAAYELASSSRAGKPHITQTEWYMYCPAKQAPFVWRIFIIKFAIAPLTRRLFTCAYVRLCA